MHSLARSVASRYLLASLDAKTIKTLKFVLVSRPSYTSADEKYRSLERDGLIEYHGGNYRLSERGIDVLSAAKLTQKERSVLDRLRQDNASADMKRRLTDTLRRKLGPGAAAELLGLTIPELQEQLRRHFKATSHQVPEPTACSKTFGRPIVTF